MTVKLSCYSVLRLKVIKIKDKQLFVQVPASTTTSAPLLSPARPLLRPRPRPSPPVSISPSIPVSVSVAIPVPLPVSVPVPVAVLSSVSISLPALVLSITTSRAANVRKHGGLNLYHNWFWRLRSKV